MLDLHPPISVITAYSRARRIGTRVGDRFNRTLPLRPAQTPRRACNQLNAQVVAYQRLGTKKNATFLLAPIVNKRVAAWRGTAG